MDLICNSKLLMIGAGGIGCELLKNLVLTGFKYITVIDLDTIELSNLNRQFLFQREHIGKPKAIVARDVCSRMNESCEIVALHQSIFNSEFNLLFYSQFDLVINALDNNRARSHVNRMCVQAKKPFIESGTVGYNGNVKLIYPYVTSCFECYKRIEHKKHTEKVYPNCTIRNTPSKMIHCVIWAKHLFNQLFGVPDAEDMVSPETTTDDNEETDKVLESLRSLAISVDYEGQRLFDRLFYDDINYLLRMKDLWKERQPPTPYKFDILIQETERNDKKISRKKDEKKVMLETEKIGTIQENVQLFVDSIKKLNKRLKEVNSIEWDKDDPMSIDFTCSAANIRGTVFDIGPLISPFACKTMSSNIIPAIASTNAITAGLIVGECIRFLRIVTEVIEEKEQISNEEKKKKIFEECRVINIYMKQKDRILQPSEFDVPDENCLICSTKNQSKLYRIKLDLKSISLRQLEFDILQNDLNMIAPELIWEKNNSITILLSVEEEDRKSYLTTGYLEKKLSEYDIIHGTILNCVDAQQNYSIDLLLEQMSEKELETMKENDEKYYSIIAVSN
ncbi:hypothetical protein SNEBB_010204 [Seison nebaliae]|nr:hypothetical protein SNEBB_010204 [Seison nebaliae]